GIDIPYVPKGFYIGNFQIAFYGLIIAIGMLIGILTASYNAKRTGQKSDTYYDFSVYAIIFSVIGARIYYVIFAWEYYKDDLKSIFNLRQGGLAIYGGVITAFIVIFVFCRLKKINPYELGDTGLISLILGQAIGRWGNFTNREVFGEYTDSLLAMRLPVEDVRARDISESILAHMEAGQNYIQVHPTFLYESLWNLALFLLMMVLLKKKHFHGELCLLYLGGYGLGRFWIEGIRTDTLFLPGTTLPVSQLLAGIMVVFSVVLEILLLRKMKGAYPYPYKNLASAADSEK
ncbi:MAG: prolipoprotein diacylglyceryl transferase, partial [Lachnospiraceae bacterium]|nr:prolipoprotein diacylglyceryl transferase [Lachnospiraceae bacterium]